MMLRVFGQSAKESKHEQNGHCAKACEYDLVHHTKMYGKSYAKPEIDASCRAIVQEPYGEGQKL
jgi:hypothetical protein